MRLSTTFEEQIRIRLAAYPWYGVDPIRTRNVMELGKYLDPKKTPNPDEYVSKLLQAADKLEASRQWT